MPPPTSCSLLLNAKHIELLLKVFGRTGNSLSACQHEGLAHFNFTNHHTYFVKAHFSLYSFCCHKLFIDWLKKPNDQLVTSCVEENESLEELNLAGNIELEQHKSHGNNETSKKSSTDMSDAVNKLQSASKGVCKLDQAEGKPEHNENEQEEPDLDHLEAADSYDNNLRGAGAESGLDDTCTSQGKANASQPENRPIEGLATSISNLRQLQLLDLSDNGFSREAADMLFNAWCSGSRAGLAKRHVKGQTLHLCIQGRRCCGLKPCCKKD